ncbi:MAG: AraC family transcriptional regulator [Desulfobacteraceae bacterium]|nr:MAG: AraC family transcriptional regulator [Desulfobacteraceae bacterium]
MDEQKNTYREYEPSLNLKPFLHCYWAYDTPDSDRGHTGSNPIIPDGCVDIIFNLNLPTQSECFVVGPMTQPIFNTKNNLFGIRFKPGMAASFFQSPIREMTDQILTLNHIDRFKTQNIADHLANSTSPGSKTALVESIFEQMLSGKPGLERRVQFAINAIESSNGNINVQELTHQIGWSRQHFTRQFLNITGLSPKFFSQVIKVNRVINIHKDQKCGCSLGDLAQIGGYYDQAHMTNAFKKITGLTPQLFFKNI